MDLDIRLLGPPGADTGAGPAPLRGRKAWALLAYLVLADRPPSRERLSSMLFADAADPAGALRWNLSQLRRSLGVEVTGDPVVLRLPTGARVDVLRLRDGHAEDAVAATSLGEELLAGIDLTVDPGFDAWLEGERRHLRRLALDVRGEAALGRLGRGDVAGALRLARQVAQADPFDENAGALLVRCLRAAGRHEDARAAARDVARRLRDHLGVEPTAALWGALAEPPGGDRRVSGRGAVLAQLTTGRASVAAGAVDSGIGALQSAVVAARALGDAHLLARTLTALGEALIHAVRGVDQDGLTLLHEAVPLAEQVGDGVLASVALREIGYVDFLRARYHRASRALDRARAAAGDDTAARAWADLYDGAVAADVGDATAAERMASTLETAQAVRDLRLEAFVRAFIGRAALLAGDLAQATAQLESSLATAGAVEWTGFLGFPQSMLADAWRSQGRLEAAGDAAQEALALAEQVGDPCWESLALRSLGLVEVDRGRVAEGVDLLVEAPPRCRRLPDTYRWIEAYGLDALVAVGARRGLPRTSTWADELRTMTTTFGMRPLQERAASYLAAVA